MKPSKRKSPTHLHVVPAPPCRPRGGWLGGVFLRAGALATIEARAELVAELRARVADLEDPAGEFSVGGGWWSEPFTTEQLAESLFIGSGGAEVVAMLAHRYPPPKKGSRR